MSPESQSQVVGNVWAERARRAAVDVEAKRQVLEAALELRDRLVLEGVDAGYTQGEVARALLMARSRVHQIVARRG